jgi:hypothetical protein
VRYRICAGLVVVVLVSGCSSPSEPTAATTISSATTTTGGQAPTSSATHAPTTLQGATTTTASQTASTTTSAPQRVDSFSVDANDFDGDCAPFPAGPIFNDVLIVTCRDSNNDAAAIAAYDLSAAGRRLWRLTPTTTSTRFESWGVGPDAVALMVAHEKPASGLSKATETHTMRMLDPRNGGQIGTEVQIDIADGDLETINRPEIQAMSLGGGIFVAWDPTSSYGADREAFDAFAEAYTADGTLLWHIDGLHLDYANQHMARVWGVDDVEGNGVGVLHLDSGRLIVADSAKDFGEAFDMCSTTVFGTNRRVVAADTADDATYPRSSSYYAAAPGGLYTFPSSDVPYITRYGFESGNRWEIDADPDVVAVWKVEGGVIIVSTRSAGRQSIDPLTGDVAAYAGPIDAENGFYWVYPEWVVHFTQDRVLTVLPNELESDCPFYDTSMAVDDSFAVFSGAVPMP